jgi:hypothetical protein
VWRLISLDLSSTTPVGSFALGLLAIAKSSLEELEVRGGKYIWTYQAQAMPVRSLDFAFSQIGDIMEHLKIN